MKLVNEAVALADTLPAVASANLQRLVTWVVRVSKPAPPSTVTSPSPLGWLMVIVSLPPRAFTDSLPTAGSLTRMSSPSVPVVIRFSSYAGVGADPLVVGGQSLRGPA